jgi:hypothetical protein
MGRPPDHRCGCPRYPPHRHRRQRDLKKVSLEFGGKSPDIVFADADRAAAIAVSPVSLSMSGVGAGLELHNGLHLDIGVAFAKGDRASQGVGVPGGE